MDRESKRAIEEFRRNEAGPIENNLIDELIAGDLSRKDFLRRSAMFGLAAGTVGSLLGAVGEAPAAAAGFRAARAKAGGTLRIGLFAPTATPEPSKLADEGGLGVASIPGEFLTFSDKNLQLQPWLATSWKPNATATVWTFQIRKGVKFHNGQSLTADDVVATFKVLAGPKSAAASAFAGILTPAGVVKSGPYTVQFHLQQPTGGFPYLVSQTTYQAVILPKNYAGNWLAAKFVGTGPYKFVSYTPNVGAKFVRNTAYWGGNPPLDGVTLTFYQGTAPQVLALKAGTLDLVQQLSAQEASSFANNSRYQTWEVKTSNHREIGMRTDIAPFNDARVRRAVALTLDRPGMIKTLFNGRATLGNDNPIWTGYPSHDPSVKQRVQNISLAKALLAAAGKSNLSFTITTYKTQEIPDLAQIIASAGNQAGMNISLEFLSGSDYYGSAPGADYQTTTPWLNRPCVITDYGHRAIPNVFLTSAFQSGGVWNQAHYANPKFDSAVKSYIGAADLTTQRRYAKTIEGILLSDTPVIIPYFYSYVAVGSSKVKGYSPEGLGGLELRGVSLG
jgi:peptide/nickel transport system substrate-binding protein